MATNAIDWGKGLALAAHMRCGYDATRTAEMIDGLRLQLSRERRRILKAAREKKRWRAFARSTAA
jgi:hypothetical protein